MEGDEIYILYYEFLVKSDIDQFSLQDLWNQLFCADPKSIKTHINQTQKHFHTVIHYLKLSTKHYIAFYMLQLNLWNLTPVYCLQKVCM